MLVGADLLETCGPAVVGQREIQKSLDDVVCLDLGGVRNDMLSDLCGGRFGRFPASSQQGEHDCRVVALELLAGFLNLQLLAFELAVKRLDRTEDRLRNKLFDLHVFCLMKLDDKFSVFFSYAGPRSESFWGSPLFRQSFPPGKLHVNLLLLSLIRIFEIARRYLFGHKRLRKESYKKGQRISKLQVFKNTSFFRHPNNSFSYRKDSIFFVYLMQWEIIA